MQIKHILPPPSEHTVVCMYCGRILKVGHRPGISHGLCGTCLDREFPEKPTDLEVRRYDR